MLRRIVDLTQTVSPQNHYYRDFPPQWSDFEATGPERMRVEMQKLVKAEPFHLDGHPDELMMNITIGHSTGHTHVDVFMHDWETMYEEIPRDKKWTQRDIAQVPSHEMLGPVAVVDISEVAPFGEVTLDFFKSKAAHVQRGDMVFIKSGHPALVREGKYNTGDFTVIGPDIPIWLGTEKDVRVCGFDHKINGNFAAWSRAEKQFYRNGILMIDRMANLEQLESGARYFASVGLSYKMEGVDDSPARVFVIDKLSGLIEGGKTTDLFFPVDCPWTAGDGPFPRSEPFALKSEVMNRLTLHNIHITQTEYEALFGGPGFMAYKTFCNHLGTHLKVPYTLGKGAGAYDLAHLPSGKLWGRCVAVDAWNAGPGQDITAALLDRKGSHVKEGDIVLLRTAYTDYYAKHPDYLARSPGLSKDAVQWLIRRNVKMVVADFATMETTAAKGKLGVHEHLSALFEKGILVVLGAQSIWRVRQPLCTAFVSPMAFPNLNASPCRVQVCEEYV